MQIFFVYAVNLYAEQLNQRPKLASSPLRLHVNL